MRNYDSVIYFKEVEFMTQIGEMWYKAECPYGRILGWLSNDRQEFSLGEIECHDIFYQKALGDAEWEDCEETDEVYQQFMNYIEKKYINPNLAEAVA